MEGPRLTWFSDSADERRLLTGLKQSRWLTVKSELFALM